MGPSCVGGRTERVHPWTAVHSCLASSAWQPHPPSSLFRHPLKRLLYRRHCHQLLSRSPSQYRRQVKRTSIWRRWSPTGASTGDGSTAGLIGGGGGFIGERIGGATTPGPIVGVRGGSTGGPTAAVTTRRGTDPPRSAPVRRRGMDPRDFPRVFAGGRRYWSS